MKFAFRNMVVALRYIRMLTRIKSVRSFPHISLKLPHQNKASKASILPKCRDHCLHVFMFISVSTTDAGCTPCSTPLLQSPIESSHSVLDWSTLRQLPRQSSYLSLNTETQNIAPCRLLPSTAECFTVRFSSRVSWRVCWMPGHWLPRGASRGGSR